MLERHWRGIDSRPSNKQPLLRVGRICETTSLAFTTALVRSPLFMAALAENTVLTLFLLARSKTMTPSTVFFARMQTYYHFSQDIQTSLHYTVAASYSRSLAVTFPSGMSWCAKEKLLPLSIGNVRGGVSTIGSIPKPSITQRVHHSSGSML